MQDEDDMLNSCFAAFSIILSGHVHHTEHAGLSHYHAYFPKWLSTTQAAMGLTTQPI
jgi:hypothetical protein